MAIEITPQVESLMYGIYAGGQYASEMDVLETALKLLHERDRLRRELQRGCVELDRGDRLDADKVFAELRELLITH